MSTPKEVSEEIKKVEERTKNLTPVMDNVLAVMRKDFEEQLNQSKGPDGSSWAPLKDTGNKGHSGSRRSSKPYDTSEHTTWDAFVKGGTVNKTKDGLSIVIETEGAWATDKRPIGTSDKAAEEISELIANWLIEPLE